MTVQFSTSTAQATLRTVVVSAVTVAATVGAVAVATTSASSESGEAFVMTATGEAGKSVRGHCVVDREDGRQSVEIAEIVPFVRRFAGARIRCTLDAAGRVAVEVTRDGSRTRSETSGGTIVLDMRGPSTP